MSSKSFDTDSLHMQAFVETRESHGGPGVQVVIQADDTTLQVISSMLQDVVRGDLDQLNLSQGTVRLTFVPRAGAASSKPAPAKGRSPRRNR